ncbi:MAG: hypothetical protein ACLVEV_05025 [Lachnospiraceae bacterium]|uniref:hypothetical protein n=1 Tax=Parablautia sp. Marseille-Q6255 TaxID=3039593 RepID=UPI0024BD53EC|nr:hypothetical protein [Parablautia sp. Marseille-Q6255]
MKLLLKLLSLFKILGSVSGLGLVGMILLSLAQGGFSGADAAPLTGLDIYTIIATFLLGLCNLAGGIFGLKGAAPNRQSLMRAVLLGWAGLILAMADAAIVVFLFESPVDMVTVATSLVSSGLFVFAASRIGAQTQLEK